MLLDIQIIPLPKERSQDCRARYTCDIRQNIASIGKGNFTKWDVLYYDMSKGTHLASATSAMARVIFLLHPESQAQAHIEELGK